MEVYGGEPKVDIEEGISVDTPKKGDKKLTVHIPEETKTALTDLFRHYVPGSVAQNLIDHATFTGGKVIVTGVNLTQTQAADLMEAFKSKFFLLPTEISASTFPQEC